MIVSVPFAFQVRSLQGLVKLETELARRTPRKLSSLNHVKSEKLSPWGLCKVRIRTADPDGGCGRRTADGGRRTADNNNFKK